MKKIIAFILMIVAALAVSSVAVSANPYTGYNRIGGYYEYGTTWFGSGVHAPSTTITVPNYQIAYPTVPRAGGWFGNSVGWVTGLRSPVYGCMTPTTTSAMYRTGCSGGGWYGSGYGQPQASNYRVRTGGAFVY